MTRKDFELVADVVAALSSDAKFEAIKLRLGDSAAPVTTAAQTYGIALRFADALATTNPAFDRSKFVRACLSGTR